MEQILEQIPEGERVLIVRLRSLGDCVLTTPAISLLKAARPDLEIAVVVEDRFAAIFERNPDITQLMPPNVAQVALWRGRLAINFHGGTRSMALVTASGAKFRAGFEHFRAAALYNVRIPTAQEILGVDRTVHTAEHLASAMFYLGVPHQEIPRARLVADIRKPPQPYAVIHPLASAPDKTWPAERFVAVAAHLRTKLGIEPVFIGAGGEDLTPFVRFRTIVGGSLSKIKNMIANASLFLGNDSGPAHMAAAFGVPVAVVFGASSIDIWRPWKTRSVVLSSTDGIAGTSTAEMIGAIEQLRGTS
jgi:ADP-heptose:LPS heptosyltransferase